MLGAPTKVLLMSALKLTLEGLTRERVARGRVEERDEHDRAAGDVPSTTTGGGLSVFTLAEEMPS